jgi:hypothetical protein
MPLSPAAQDSVVARGQARPDRRNRQPTFDRLGLRQGVSRARRGACGHLRQWQDAEIRRALGARARCRDRDADERAAGRAGKRSSRASRRNGAGSIFSCTPSPPRPRRRCADAWSTHRVTDSCRRWISAAGPSSAWHAWRNPHEEPKRSLFGTDGRADGGNQPQGASEHSVFDLDQISRHRDR